MKSAFDVGLVTVEVFVRASTINVELNAYLPPVPIRRFSLVERVVEINGKSVVQTDIGEQVFYLAPGGEFVGLVKDAAWGDISQEEGSGKLASLSARTPLVKCNLARLRSSFKAWFNRLPVGLKCMIGSAWATIGIFWALFLGLRIVQLLRRARSGYSKVDEEKVAECSGYSDEKVKEMELEVESFGLPKYASTPSEDNDTDGLCK